MTDALDDARNGVVWVVEYGETKPTSHNGELVLYYGFADSVEYYWRAKLDSGGNPTEWERFWVEE